MEIPGPDGPDSERNPALRRGRLWRSLLILGGGVAGVVAGVALSAAFSSAADASPLPAPSALTAPVLGAVTATPGSIAKTGSNILGGPSQAISDVDNPTVSSTVNSVMDTTHSLTTAVNDVTGPIASSLATSFSSAIRGGSSGAIVLPFSTQSPLTTMAGTVTIDPFAALLGFPQKLVPDSGTPTAPGPPPVHPHPSQTPPPTTNESAEYSSQSQGGSPFGALPPTTLLVPALLLGAVLLAREKTPLFMFDLRYSPPG